LKTLQLEFWTEHDDFCIYAEAAGYEKELTLEGQAKVIVSHFNRVYDILEEKKENRAEDLQADLRWLSERLLTPFLEPLKRCDQVRFIVFEDLIRCAFDLLLFEGRYLFLQRAVCYQVEESTGKDVPAVAVENALLIADLTADPEEACREVSRLIPKSTYLEVQEAGPGAIKAVADEIKVLVISAHGDLDDDNEGALYIKDEEAVTPKLIGKLKADVVYFDSCQQGINMAYLQALQDAGNGQFYLAPIISNDAGDSSTKTMVWFFTALLAQRNPINALFETRKRLFDFYINKKKLDLVTGLNKAFPFRLYEFVEVEK